MLVSWEWLSQYVQIDLGHEAMANRWAMTGLNHESTVDFGGDPVIDLEVTSNRGDCLGHIGIAREASVLCAKPLTVPDPQPIPGAESIAGALSIANQFTEACPRYTGRVIRGVRIANSPAWLQRRLQAIGVRPINNIVDATNYVMFECGQPLHAFDFAKVRGGKIIVRRAYEKEAFMAIDHKSYILDSQMVVIADAERAVALGGVMGGLESEVGETTVDVLIESAEFSPMAVRRAARKLKLHSPSSYRYERRVDGAQLDWASRRCCELILQIAGGTLLTGSVEAGSAPAPRQAIRLRSDRISRVLGIDVPWARSLEILSHLGCHVVDTSQADQASILPPSFRADLSREIDLIEEVARIHGYDQIPEDAAVPLVSSAKRPKDMMMQTVRHVVCGAGFDETLTPSLIGKSPASDISPWTSLPAMSTMAPLLEGASLLRRSLIPSLIAARLYNQSQSNRDVRLFETANIYLGQTDSKLPQEQHTLGLVADADIRIVSGVIEEIVHRTCGPEFLRDRLRREPIGWSFLAPGSGLAWKVGSDIVAWTGELHRSIGDSMKLDAKLAISELNLDRLQIDARLVPQLQPIVPFPTVERDLNLIVDEGLQWSQLASAVSQAAGPLCIEIIFREVYRDTKKDGAGKKRVLFGMLLRSPHETLRSEQADEIVERVLKACEHEFQARLLG